VKSAPKPSILPILAVNFVGTLGFSIVLPFLVFLVVRLGGNSLVYGVVGATYSVFQLVGAPILGRWSDRVGRKKVLLVSQLGTLASWGIFLLALTLPLTTLASVDSPILGQFTLTLPLAFLFLSRALDGLTGGNVSVANAYLADITTEADRSRNFGRLAVASNLGFILGPTLAGLLGATAAGERLPVLAAFLISIVATLIILIALKDPEPCVLKENPEPPSVRDVLGGDQKDCYRIESGDTLSTREILALPSVGRLLGVQFLVFLAFNFYYVAFPLYASTTLAWSLAQVGIYFAVMSLLMALVQGPVLSFASRRVDNRTLVLVGSLLLAASFTLFTSASTRVIYAGAALLALGNGVMWPSLLALLSSSTERELQGTVQGLSGSFGALASIAGLVLGGALFQAVGSRVFLLAAMVAVGVALVSARISAPVAPSAGMPRASA